MRRWLVAALTAFTAGACTSPTREEVRQAPAWDFASGMPDLRGMNEEDLRALGSAYPELNDRLENASPSWRFWGLLEGETVSEQYPTLGTPLENVSCIRVSSSPGDPKTRHGFAMSGDSEFSYPPCSTTVRFTNAIDNVGNGRTSTPAELPDWPSTWTGRERNKGFLGQLAFRFEVDEINGRQKASHYCISTSFAGYEDVTACTTNEIEYGDSVGVLYAIADEDWRCRAATGGRDCSTDIARVLGSEIVVSFYAAPEKFTLYYTSNRTLSGRVRD